MHLVVVAPFGRWLRGEVIAVADEIAHALEHHHTSVVRVAAPPPAAPDPATDAKE